MKDLSPLNSFVSFAPPLMGAEEIEEVADTLRSGWLTTGPKTERFEKDLAAYIGCGRGLALNSCTAALHLGLKVLGVGPGQGVITTPLTFASTAHAVMYLGARPFLVDIDPSTGNLDPDKVRDFLECHCHHNLAARPVHKETGLEISAILPVHYGGHPVELDAFWRLAEDYGLNMLEDAAHAIGAAWRGLKLGSPPLRPQTAAHLQSLTAFSFYATKNMATGEGGYLVAADEEPLERARILSMYGISDSRRIWDRYAPKGTWVYDVADLGFKYNMMDIQAALGLWQLRRLDEFIWARAAHAQRYHQALESLSELVIRPQTRPLAEHAWHLYALRLKPGALKVERDQFIEILRQHNLGSSVLFIPLHYHSFYKNALGYEPGDFPAAEAFFQNLINLPVAPAHSPQAIESAAELLAALLAKYRR